VSTIALLTDFGTADVFVGIMKGVIRGLAPQAVVVDLTHEVPPGDITVGALRAWQAAPHLPRGTVLLAVVDPGVGTGRRAIAAATASLAFVGPDNGIFSWVLALEPGCPAVELAVPPGSSATFHGRDVFAPAAARLCSGAPLASLGAPAKDLKALPFPRLLAENSCARGEVLLHDRFGNVLTSIRIPAAGDGVLTVEPWMPGLRPTRLEGSGFQVLLPGGRAIPVARTFSDVPPGNALAYVGSDGLLEIAVNGGNAAEALGLSRGSEVILSTEK